MAVIRKKKIWIDLDNSPHVPFFTPIIDELTARGCDVVLTARNAFQVGELIEDFKLSARLIGRHYGKNMVLKAIGLFHRVFQMAPLVLKEKPDLALSHGVRTQVVLASVLRIPSVIISDYEYSKALPFPRPTWVIVPEIIPDKVNKRDNVLKYPGIKEDVYVPDFKPNGRIRRELRLSEKDLVVTVRPPATEAHYHNPLSEQLLVAVINFLGPNQNTRIVMLPRNGKQASFVRKRWSELYASGKIIIPDRVVNGLNLIWYSDLVVSGGGTMNREAAALGVPAYSIFRGKIGAVDEFLANSGCLTLLKSVHDVRSKIFLIRRDRPPKPDNTNSLALCCIVDHVVAILEGTGNSRSLGKVCRVDRRNLTTSPVQNRT